MNLYKGYEMVVGLEVHVELKTKTKMFCGCRNVYGAEPNSCCCPTCLGLPGALPTLNRQAVRYAVMAGIATECRVNSLSEMARKNYFYPDLPKGYQITQGQYPLLEEGHLDVDGARIGITRIHIEEDAGKLIHEGGMTYIDFNRCGVPLIEIVTEPDIRSAEQAKAFLKKLRTLILYTGISDCKMNEGSMRCDVNLSVRLPGQPYGIRTEMKNINSVSFVGKAIEYEYRRQVDALLAGQSILQETRRFDENTGRTESMRSKENSADYRYFPEPDIPAVYIDPLEIEEIRNSLPLSADKRVQLYKMRYGVDEKDGVRLTALRENADVFEMAAEKSRYPLFVCKWMLTYPTDEEIGISADQLAAIADMMGDGEINSGTAKTLLSVCRNRDTDARTYAQEHNLFQISDEETLWNILLSAAEADPKSKNDFLAGKAAAGKALVGKVMAQSGGRANGIILQKLLEKLKEM